MLAITERAREGLKELAQAQGLNGFVLRIVMVGFG